MTLSRKAAVWPHTDPFHPAATPLDMIQSVIEHREQLLKFDRSFVAEMVRTFEQEFEDVEKRIEGAQNNPHITPEQPKKRSWPLRDAAKWYKGVVNVQQQTLKEETKRHNQPKAEKKRHSELFKSFIGWNKKLKRVLLSSNSDSRQGAASSIEDEPSLENREDLSMPNPSALPSLSSALPVSSIPEQSLPNETMPSPKADVELAQDRTRDLQNILNAAVPGAAVAPERNEPRPNSTWRWDFAPDLSKSMDRELIRRRGAVDFTPSGTFPIPPVYPSTPPPLYMDSLPPDVHLADLHLEVPSSNAPPSSQDPV